MSKDTVIKLLKQQVRDLRQAVQYQAETIRLLAERIPPQPAVAQEQRIPPQPAVAQEPVCGHCGHAVELHEDGVGCILCTCAAMPVDFESEKNNGRQNK